MNMNGWGKKNEKKRLNLLQNPFVRGCTSVTRKKTNYSLALAVLKLSFIIDLQICIECLLHSRGYHQLLSLSMGKKDKQRDK